MGQVGFLCVLIVLYLQCAGCFSTHRQIPKRVLGMPQSEGLGPYRKLCLCVLKSKPTTKVSIRVNDAQTESQAMESIDQPSEEPPFSSGFVPLLRAILPKPAAQNEKQLEKAPAKILDDGRPASSSTATLSRYSRGFIPIIRSFFR